MKRLSFKILLILVFITTAAFSQTKEVILKKSFKANENTILNLNLDNVGILFEESFDGKIHFDYSMTFGRYSKRKREMITRQSQVKVTKDKDLINLDVNNSMFLGLHHTTYLSMDSLVTSITGYMKKEVKNGIQYKTKDSLINEIRFSEGNNLQDFLKKNKMRQRDVSDISSLKNKKVIKKVFIIKVPKNVTIRLKALHSNITFDYDINKPLVANTFKGFLKFKKIASEESKVFITLGVFETEEIEGGDYTFKDVSKALIGSVSNAKIDTETSKIQIGEIGKNVVFNDFNSKAYLHNFSNNFNEFKYKGAYSKLFFYNVETSNYSMDVYGKNTVLSMNNIKTTFNASKEASTKILHKEAKKGKVSNGNIELKLTNGILNIAPEKKE
ncbi:MAG: hypothetical protein JXR05_00430 [Flavobacteriaceae bacterium]